MNLQFCYILAMTWLLLIGISSNFLKVRGHVKQKWLQ